MTTALPKEAVEAAEAAIYRTMVSERGSYWDAADAALTAALPHLSPKAGEGPGPSTLAVDVASRVWALRRKAIEDALTSTLPYLSQYECPVCGNLGRLCGAPSKCPYAPLSPAPSLPGVGEHAFEAFKNERDYIAQSGRLKTTVAAMDWAANEIAQLRAALKPFGYYYDLNDCHERKPDDALDVPVSDLRRAFELVGADFPYAETAPAQEPKG